MKTTRVTSTSAPSLALGLALAGAMAGSVRGSAVSVGALSVVAIQGESKALSIVVGRSQHMSLPWPAKGVSITDPAVADVQILTPQILQVSGKSVGTTNVLVWGDSGQTLEAKVDVNSDLDRLSSELATIFPASSIKLSQSQNAMLVSGSFERAEQSEILHRYLDAQKVNYVDLTTLAGVQQVQVQVRMAEVSRTAIRALGVSGVVAGSDAFGGTNLGGLNPTSITPSTGPFSGRLPFDIRDAGGLSPSVTLFGGLTSGDLAMFVRALAENDYLRILAEPNLVALSGAEANFLAGGEVPIPVVQGGAGAAGSISIEFKPFGISLKFRPTVVGEGGIRLEVASEVSEVSENVETLTQIGPVKTPSFITRRAETTLEIKSGQTFAMAGLLSEHTTAISSRVPGLGDLPILGALFRSVEYKKGETELLILVTASLVEPVSELSLPSLPGAVHVEPSDWELYFEGRLGGRYQPSPSEQDAQSMKALGFERLRGPGAWMNYGQTPAVSTAHSAPPASESAVPPAPKD
jgi:pilus assembly protein CpaC